MTVVALYRMCVHVCSITQQLSGAGRGHKAKLVHGRQKVLEWSLPEVLCKTKESAHFKVDLRAVCHCQCLGVMLPSDKKTATGNTGLREVTQGTTHNSLRNCNTFVHNNNVLLYAGTVRLCRSQAEMQQTVILQRQLQQQAGSASRPNRGMASAASHAAERYMQYNYACVTWLHIEDNADVILITT